MEKTLTALIEKVHGTELQDLETVLFENFSLSAPIEDECKMLLREAFHGVPVTTASKAYGLSKETAFCLMLGLCYGGLLEFNMVMLHQKGEMFISTEK